MTTGVITGEAGVLVAVIGVLDAVDGVEVAAAEQDPATLSQSPFLMETHQIVPVAWSVISRPCVTAAVCVSTLLKLPMSAVTFWKITLSTDLMKSSTAEATTWMNGVDEARLVEIDSVRVDVDIVEINVIFPVVDEAMLFNLKLRSLTLCWRLRTEAARLIF